MLKLTHDNFIKAKDFIFANAEDIDRAWFRYVFEDKDEDAFLMYWQNTSMTTAVSVVCIMNLIIKALA